MNRDFKGIWVPKEVWLDENLSWIEKFLLVEIDSLDNADGCWASNGYFAKFFGVSKDRISKLISGLHKKGYVSVELVYKDGTKTLDKRIVRITDRYRYKQLGGIGVNNDRGIGVNNEDNNTSFNNTVNNTSTKDILSGKAEPRIPFKEIVDYLNQETGSRYKHTSKKTQSLIRARFNDGFTLDDFKKVIDIKTAEWKDTDMSKFLRPETLFGTKFESYLNQKQFVKGGYDGPTRYDELF